MRISEADEGMLHHLGKLHLRHPGMVKPRIVNLLKRQQLTPEQLAACRIELLQLTKGAKP